MLIATYNLFIDVGTTMAQVLKTSKRQVKSRFLSGLGSIWYASYRSVSHITIYR